MVRDQEEEGKWKGLGVNEHWQQMKRIMMETAQDICGMTKSPCRHKETWWWNEEVAEAVRDKKLSYHRGTRDASCQLKSCQLPRNSAENTCTTSPEQIKVMKLESYSKAMCNKHVHSTMTRSSCFHCPIGVINKPTTATVELWISPVYRRLVVAKFSKSTM